MTEKPTIEDVARLAKVSIATVSRVINNLDGVRPKTKEKIQDAIEQLNYIPNQIARSMIKKETKTIGIIIPDIKNPFFPLVVSGIEQKAREMGYFTMLSNTNECPEIEKELIGVFQERGLDGLIITTADEDGEHLKTLIDNGVPLVAVDRSINKFNVDTVLVGNVDGAYQATRHLVFQGHHDIAIICGPQNTTPGRERFLGYKRALEDFNLDFNDTWIKYGDFKQESGYDLTKELYFSEKRPSAIFSSNNLMTKGCIKALEELDWKLGEQVSLIGFDDLDIAEYMKPALTVVSRPMQKLGEVAFDLLYERMTVKTPLKTRKYVLSPELIIRNSCGIPLTR